MDGGISKCDLAQSFTINKISSWNYYPCDCIKNKIKVINPDGVCMQEILPVSFEVDFVFMRNELG
jgi:hypothetical protein